MTPSPHDPNAGVGARPDARNAHPETAYCEGRARLHWFPRAAIAVVAAFLILSVVSIVEVKLLPMDLWANVPFQIAHAVIRPVVPLAFYGLLTLWFGPNRRRDRETRCRECDYILRGITEPRCPECGERI